MTPKLFGSARWSGLLPLAAALVLVSACDDDPTDPTGGSHFGEVAVNITTAGYEPDFTGYSVGLEGGGAVATDFDDEVVLFGAPAGNNTVVLSGVADHCTVANNPATVSVTAGQQASVDFDVTCDAITGSTTLTVTQTGEALDLDANLTALVDSGATGEVSEAFATAAPHTILHLAEGAHEVRLQNIAENCTPVARILPVTVTLGADAPLAFALDCVPNVGDLHVVLTTTGTNLDTGYQVTVTGLEPANVGVNGTVEFTDQRVGLYTVVLGDVAENCDIAGSSANRDTQNATVTFGDVTEIEYAITCE